MSDFLRDWLHNLWVGLLALIGVGLFMLVFMKIFYPESLGFLFLTGQFTVGLVNILRLWPVVILAVIVYAMPRRRRRR
jgi:hypothetical protein